METVTKKNDLIVANVFITPAPHSFADLANAMISRGAVVAARPLTQKGRLGHEEVEIELGHAASVVMRSGLSEAMSNRCVSMLVDVHVGYFKSGQLDSSAALGQVGKVVDLINRIKHAQQSEQKPVGGKLSPHATARAKRKLDIEKGTFKPVPKRTAKAIRTASKGK